MAYLDHDDENHATAVGMLDQILDDAIPLFTSNYVVLESSVLLQRRLGMEALRGLQEVLVPLIEVHWIGQDVHEIAMTALMAARRRKLSLVDCTSFVVMRAAGCQEAFAFDKHFKEEGFRFPS